MTEETPRRTGIRDQLRKFHDLRNNHPEWFWMGTITFGAVLALFVGSQIARDTGQNVDWYTGFGQWLGGIGSLIAAGIALWIATTDRHRADQQREADLAREAGLVRITFGKLPKRQFVGPSYLESGIAMTNRRTTRIFEIKVARFVLGGQEAELLIESVDILPREQVGRYRTDDLSIFVIEPDEALHIFPTWLDGGPVTLVVVEYTDSSGRRWQVDTEDRVERLP